MENKNNTKREVIIEAKGDRESIYYLCLFGVALLVSIALMIFAINKGNEGLTTYSYFLVPIFALSVLSAVRYLLATKDPVYVKDGALYVKRYFFNKKFLISDIEKITVAAHGEKERYAVNVYYGDKTYNYEYHSITKDAAAKLRKICK